MYFDQQYSQHIQGRVQEERNPMGNTREASCKYAIRWKLSLSLEGPSVQEVLLCAENSPFQLKSVRLGGIVDRNSLCMHAESARHPTHFAVHWSSPQSTMGLKGQGGCKHSCLPHSCTAFSPYGCLFAEMLLSPAHPQISIPSEKV